MRRVCVCVCVCLLLHPQPSIHSTQPILAVQRDLMAAGVSGQQPWDRVVFKVHPSYASALLLNLGSWDEPKRQLVRRVLREARENFHRHPRPWYVLKVVAGFLVANNHVQYTAWR